MPHRRCFMEMELTFYIGRAENKFAILYIQGKGSFQHMRLTDNTDSVFVNEHRPMHVRICSQRRSYLLPDASESAPRGDRIWRQTRLRLLPCSLNGIGLELTPLRSFCQTILSILNFKRVSQQRLTRKSR